MSEHKEGQLPQNLRCRGAVIGLAVGDAVGTTLEFQATHSAVPLEDMVGGGPFGLEPGQWTDDTSMALCLAESLIQKRAFNGSDQLKRYLQWYREGNNSSNGECFDIGITARTAVLEYEKDTSLEFAGHGGEGARIGNGCIMRLAPIPIFFKEDPARALEEASKSSNTTHGAALCLDACRYFAALVIGAFQGATKEQLLADRFYPEGVAEEYWKLNPMVSEINEIATGSFKGRSPPDIKGSGRADEALECVLWGFYHTTSFKEGLLKIVNLGGDTDTTGAIYGQLAGAYYGEEEIPKEWRDKLALGSWISCTANELISLAEKKVYLSSSPEECPLSDEYSKGFECFKMLEEGYKPVLRRLLPGVHTYKTMKAFEDEAAAFLKSYDDKAPLSELKSILKQDLELRLQANRKKLKAKLDRPAMPMMGANLKEGLAKLKKADQ